MLTGKSITEHHDSRSKPPLPYRLLKLALAPADRSRLHDRIEKRFTSMLEEGLLAEVEALYRRGDLTAAKPAVRAVGYRQLWEYLEGKTGLEEAEVAARGVQRPGHAPRIAAVAQGRDVDDRNDIRVEPFRLDIGHG